jgi:hypothetical protein
MTLDFHYCGLRTTEFNIIDRPCNIFFLGVFPQCVSIRLTFWADEYVKSKATLMLYVKGKAIPVTGLGGP